MLSNKVSTVFLMLVLVLGLASYPTLQPNFGSNFDAYDQSHLQLTSLAFAQEDTQIELDEEIEIEEEENGSEEEEENGSEEEENGSEKVEGEHADEENDEKEIEIEVEVEDGVAKVKVEFNDEKHKIMVESTDEADIAAAILALPGFPSEINPMDIWDFEVEDEEKDGDGEHEGEEEIKIKVKVKDGVAKVKVKFNDEKHKFLVESTDEGDIAAAILAIPGFPSEINPMDKWDFEVKDGDGEHEGEDELEIEVEVEDGVAKVKVKFNDQKHRFLVTDDTSEGAIAAAILALPGFPSEINPMDIWDFEVEEEEDEIDSTSTTTTAFNEWEAQQTSQEMYDDLQQKYDELKEQMQILMAKLDSGEYYGNVPEVDSEINSYTISFTGSATSTDDDSIVYAEGEIYIESLMTGESASKYTVTGGEITIDDTFYEYVFGKVRVSSGSMIIIGQVLDWTGDDDSTTIKLVIHSDMPLGGDFGSEPIDIEILPQSKIAGQWHLSGTGSLSII